jgi:hypothetical protein
MRNAGWEDEDEDLDLFWREAELAHEPLAWRWYLPVAVLLLVLNVPWYLSPEVLERIYHGLPLFAWMALATSFGLSCLICWAALRHWRGSAPGAVIDQAVDGEG